MEDPSGSEEEAAHERKSTKSQGSHTPPEVSMIPLTECPLTHAIFKELSVINSKINAMNRKELIAKLKKYHLNHKGDFRVLQRRLKNYFRVRKLTNAKLMETQVLEPYYVVIDFEATCQENNPVDFKYEIIEFPGILVHTESLKVVDVFHSYIKPKLHPKLTAFCTSLTGISQEDVDKAPTFKEVLRKFESWLDSHGLLSRNKFIVTDGPWDMGRFLYLQCKLSKVPYPAYAKEWINLRRVFRNFYKFHQGGNLEDMVKFVGLRFEGRAHSGLDDSYNIARIFLHLLKDGAIIRTNERITQHARSHNNMNAIPIHYKKPMNTHEDMIQLRNELANISISDSDEETNGADNNSGILDESLTLETTCDSICSSSEPSNTKSSTSGKTNSTSDRVNSPSIKCVSQHTSGNMLENGIENNVSQNKSTPKNTITKKEIICGNPETYDRILEILNNESSPRRFHKRNDGKICDKLSSNKSEQTNEKYCKNKSSSIEINPARIVEDVL